MKKFFYLLSIVLFLLSSCTEDDTFTNPVKANAKEVSEVTISDEGYLVFPTAKSLQDYIENILDSDSTQSQSPSMFGSKSNSKFKSIAELSNQLSTLRANYNIQKQIKSQFLSGSEQGNNIDDLEEMTQDEFNLMKAENLLLDDVMRHIVDTTLRISVEGRFYQITEKGTFSIEENKKDFMKKTIGRVDCPVVPVGESVIIENDVVFTKTFPDENSVKNDNVELEYVLPRPPLVENNNYTDNTFHLNYNTKSYEWKNNSVFQKVLDFIKGKSVSRENNFSKNYRVQVKVFDVNYAFYASAGIKVSMQKRKKFLGIPYWKGVEAQKIVVGFNGLDGVLKYNNPKNYSTIDPSLNKNWGTFVGSLDGIQSKFFYGNYQNLKFIKDWTDDIVCVMPEINIGNSDWKNSLSNKLYNAPAKFIYGQLRDLENRYIFNPIKRKIIPTEPKMAYLIWGNSSFTFNKEHPYIVGVKTYSACKSKSIVFDRSFGFTFISGKLPIGFLPSEFDINKLDMFGAAYYDNQWRGIRFYKY